MLLVLFCEQLHVRYCMTYRHVAGLMADPVNNKIKDDRFPNSFAADAIDHLAGCTIFLPWTFLVHSTRSPSHRVPDHTLRLPPTIHIGNGLKSHLVLSHPVLL